jgi:hypothetical protein
MQSLAIANSEELKAEIARLKVIDREQTMEIKKRFNSTKAVFLTLGSLFQKPGEKGSNPVSGLFHPDLLRLVSRFAMPLALNKTIFRNSGFLVKMIVDLVSQKAASQVSEPGAEKLFRQAKTLITGLIHKVKPLLSKKQDV